MPKRRKSPPSQLTESELEQKFYNLVLAHRLPRPVQQHKFHPTRNWRFDFSWPLLKIAVEIQGFGPGHNSYEGMLNDYEKHNEALLLGWRIIYFMNRDLDPYYADNTVAIVRRILCLT